MPIPAWIERWLQQEDDVLLYDHRDRRVWPSEDDPIIEVEALGNGTYILRFEGQPYDPSA